jgi:hypothetical protein
MGIGRNTLLATAAVALAAAVLPAAALASAPTIAEVSATQISSRDATLQARIDPEGLETTYELWIADPCPAPMECIRDAQLGEGVVPASSSGEYQIIDLARSGKHLNIEPKTIYDYWIVAKNAAGTSEDHATFKTLPAPVIENESATDVSANDATLQAQIDPRGQALWYQFQLVENPSEYASELECPSAHEGSPLLCGPLFQGALPLEFMPAGEAPQTVSLDLASAGVTLQPGRTFHYRVIAAPHVLTEDTVAWAGPPVYGTDETFTTPAAPPSPQVSSESISPVTPAGDATLQAQIDSEGLSTLFQFHLEMLPLACDAIPACLGQTYSLPSGLLLGSFLDQSVSLDLKSAGVRLQVGREYAYWVSATSTAGTTEGAHQTFRVPSEEAEPLKDTSATPSDSTAVTVPAPAGGTGGTGSQASSNGTATPAGAKPAHGVAAARRRVRRARHIGPGRRAKSGRRSSVKGAARGHRRVRRARRVGPGAVPASKALRAGTAG